MIERHWKGVVKFDETENYENHLLNGTFLQMALIPGFINAKIMKRPVKEGMEYLVVTTWKSLADIHAFAGADVDIAVVPKSAADMMITFDKKACHFEVVNEYSPPQQL